MSSPADRLAATPVRDYSLAAEPPAEAIRNVLLMLQPDNAIWPTNDALTMRHVAAIRERLMGALTQLESR